MIWTLLHIIAQPDCYEATFANGEVFIREQEPVAAMPELTMDGEWFNDPSCLEPVVMEDEPMLEAAE